MFYSLHPYCMLLANQKQTFVFLLADWLQCFTVYKNVPFLHRDKATVWWCVVCKIWTTLLSLAGLVYFTKSFHQMYWNIVFVDVVLSWEQKYFTCKMAQYSGTVLNVKSVHNPQVRLLRTVSRCLLTSSVCVWVITLSILPNYNSAVLLNLPNLNSVVLPSPLWGIQPN